MIFQPLADVIVSKYKEFLPKLVYPVRVGTHTNSAFGLIFAYEYANYTNDTELMSIIEETAKRHYAQDKYVQSIHLLFNYPNTFGLEQVFCWGNFSESNWVT